jgi:hypothetical protein
MKKPNFVYVKPQRIKLVENCRLSDGRYLPRGFQSDLGSVPRFFWWFVSPYDIKYSAIIHDYDWLEADYGEYDYRLANKVFYDNAIKLDKLPRWKAKIIYCVLELMMCFKLLGIEF